VRNWSRVRKNVGGTSEMLGLLVAKSSDSSRLSQRNPKSPCSRRSPRSKRLKTAFASAPWSRVEVVRMARPENSDGAEASPVVASRPVLTSKKGMDSGGSPGELTDCVREAFARKK